MSLGDLIKVKRLQKGWSIRQLALYAGCSDSYLSLLERNKRGTWASPDMLRKFSKTLGIPYPVLLKEIGYIDEVDPELLNVSSEVLAQPLPRRHAKLMQEIEEILRSNPTEARKLAKLIRAVLEFTKT